MFKVIYDTCTIIVKAFIAAGQYYLFTLLKNRCRLRLQSSGKNKSNIVFIPEMIASIKRASCEFKKLEKLKITCSGRVDYFIYI